jgi:tetratricopeptide (TPR) repeat protein
MSDSKKMRLATLVRQAERALESGDIASARAIAEQAAREELKHPALLRLQAEALAEAGRYPEAGSLLNQALALAPRDPLTIADIGRVLVAEDRVGEATTAFRAALSIEPGSADLWHELGSAYDLAEDDAAARAAYEKARVLAPRAAAPWASLAAIAARQGNLDEASALARESLGRQADNAAAGLVMARVELGSRAYDDARARIEALLAGNALDERQTQWALSMLGDALDGLGRAAEAFDAYTRMNQLMVEVNAPRFGAGGRVESHLELVRRLTKWFERQDPAIWQDRLSAGHVSSPVRRHVFLLGYPRSGNTLTENILASLPDVRALEERPTLVDADTTFLRTDEQMDRLVHLDPALADEQRAAYWRRVRAEVPDLDGKVFVDMAPLNGIKLQVIARLFPDAIVVRCRRDPRDVVLSCFRRHFKVNASTFQMASLESAARHFDAVMRLMELHLGALPLAVHVMDYAELIADFDGTTRELAAFVGVPWTENVRAFNRTAAGRGVKTASASQVRQALFDGTRQWLKYSEQMGPVMPLLEPWVQKFGYPLR